MSKELELIRTLIDGANEYEKKTGNTNPTVYLSKNNLLVIEKALLKAQEPKHYLKWEDLEFKKKQQVMDVLLNGKPYVLYFYKLSTQSEVNMFSVDMHIVTLNSYYPEDVQFFNDLHLERVEE